MSLLHDSSAQFCVSLNWESWESGVPSNQVSSILSPWAGALCVDHGSLSWIYFLHSWVESCQASSWGASTLYIYCLKGWHGLC